MVEPITMFFAGYAAKKIIGNSNESRDKEINALEAEKREMEMENELYEANAEMALDAMDVEIEALRMVKDAKEKELAAMDKAAEALQGELNATRLLREAQQAAASSPPQSGGFQVAVHYQGRVVTVPVTPTMMFNFDRFLGHMEAKLGAHDVKLIYKGETGYAVQIRGQREWEGAIKSAPRGMLKVWGS